MSPHWNRRHFCCFLVPLEYVDLHLVIVESIPFHVVEAFGVTVLAKVVVSCQDESLHYTVLNEDLDLRGADVGSQPVGAALDTVPLLQVRAEDEGVEVEAYLSVTCNEGIL